MMYITIFTYLICLVVLEGLDLHLMDIVTPYLHEFLHNDLYMKIPEGFQVPKATNSKHFSI